MKRSYRKPGPKTNPYSYKDSRWWPQSNDDELYRPVTPLSVRQMGVGPALSAQLGILYRRTGLIPLMRRFVEAMALHVWRFDAEMALRVIDGFANANQIWNDTLWDAKVPFRRPSVIGIWSMSEREDAILTSLLERRESILTAKVLGDAGQRWTRHHFVRSEHFKNISQAKNVGFLFDHAGENAIDLFATDLSDRRYAISIKNARDVVGTRKTMNWVAEIKAFARAHESGRGSLQPWLIPSFASDDALARCEAQGVICTPMESRIAPERYSGRKSTRLAIQELRAVIGPEPFRFVGTQRLHDADAAFLLRIEAVANRPMAAPATAHPESTKRRKSP